MQTHSILMVLIGCLIVSIPAAGATIVRYAPENWVRIALPLLGFIGGTSFSLLFTALLDVLRRPKLIVKPVEAFRNPLPWRVMWTVCLDIINEPLSKPYSWIATRNPAQRCYAKLCFYEFTPQGFPKEGGAMTGRWRSLAQPAPLFGFDCDYRRYQRRDGALVLTLNRNWNKGPIIYDPIRFDPLGQEPEQRMDLYAGQKRDIDVVCRYENESACFGFNNEFYCPAELTGYRREWNLSARKYLVKITIFSSSAPETFFLMLGNEEIRSWDEQGVRKAFYLYETRCPPEFPAREKGPVE